MVDAEKTLRDLLDKILDEIDYRPRKIDVKAITSGGANYTTVLFNAKIASPNRADLRLFAKVASFGGTMRHHMKAGWLYDTENFVYTKLMKTYEDLQDVNKVQGEHRFVFPKFYGHNAELNQETIVIEDLVAAGYETYNRLKSLDWDYASIAVDNLAKFHALSFAFEKYHPDEYEKLIPNMKCPLGVMDEEVKSSVTDTLTNIVNNAVGVLKDEYKERVRNFAMTHNMWDKYNQPIGKPVLAHGDYRLSNLLFKKQDGNLQITAVDYQTVHAGCPAGDLMYFIFLGSDEDFRSQYYEKLLDHYHSSLQQALERLSVETSVYSREKFDSDMKELLPYAVLLGVMVLPVVTVEAESAPTLDGDVDFSNFVMKPNELYTQRINGIVNDCVRWGAI